LPRRGETQRDSWELLLVLVADVAHLQPDRPAEEPLDFGAIRAEVNGIELRDR